MLDEDSWVEVLVADVSVAEAPVDAAVVVVSSVVLVTVPEAVLPLAAAARRSSPAVIVTGTRLSDMSLSTAVTMPGSLASGPASVSTQVAVCDATAQSTSSVLVVGHARQLQAACYISTW